MRAPNRYVLVARQAGNGRAPLRRFGLARIAPSPRSALGVSRHARLERIADR